MITKTAHALLLFAVLFVTWYIFSGISTPQFIIYGVISSAMAALLALRMNVVDNEAYPFHLALSAPIYWLWLLKEVVIAGLNVTRLVWTPENNSSPCFAWLPITQDNDLGRTIHANSLTLSPGTVCVDIEQKRVFIHVLEKHSIAELEEGTMDRLVTRLTSRRRPVSHRKGKKL